MKQVEEDGLSRQGETRSCSRLDEEAGRYIRRVISKFPKGDGVVAMGLKVDQMKET